MHIMAFRTLLHHIWVFGPSGAVAKLETMGRLDFLGEDANLRRHASEGQGAQTWWYKLPNAVMHIVL